MPDDGAKFPHADSDASSQSDPERQNPSPPTGPDALADAIHRLAEAREYIAHLLAAEIEKFKLRFRRAAAWAVIGITALVLLLAILVAAAGLLLTGLAELIGSLLGGRPWLGALIVGGAVLLIGVVAVAWGLWAWQRSAFDAVRESFAARRRRQLGRFGRSVESPDESSTDH
ncbi:MAG TPA: phage holin family protein [Pirellulales bacterium]